MDRANRSLMGSQPGAPNGRQENGFDRQVQLPDSPRHGEAIEFGHVEIQNRDLRQQPPDQFETNLSVTSFRQYFQIKLMFNYLTSPLRTIG